jgi:hypothetical protein
MPLAKDGTLTTVSLVVSKALNRAIRDEHARRVAAFEADTGSRRGAPTLSAVWEEYTRAGFSQAHTDTFVTTTEGPAA